jgi:hypothetical protein
MLLGGRCEWPGCDWNDARALQIDHREPQPGDRVERNSLAAHQYWRMIMTQPERFQVLCANHNWVKRCEQEEYKA